MNDEGWPVPPPFMWACPTCVKLMGLFPDARTVDAENPYSDGSLRVQIALAGHVATDHPESVPAPHEDCLLCADYERRGDNIPAWLWAEHRARELFLPTSIASEM